MRQVALLSLLGCLLAAGIAAADWIPALVANRSFELDVNRDGQPDGWTTAPFKSPAKFGWDRTVAHTGSGSVRISDSKSPTDAAWDANTARWITNSAYSCQPGTTYTLRGWIRTDLREGTAQIVLAWFGGKKWLHEDSSQRLSGRHNWTECTVSVRPPANADTVRVYLMLNDGVGSAWFDDIDLVAGTEFPAKYRPINLRAVCDAGFTDDVAGDGKGGWTDQGKNDAREIPLGRQVFRGVPFEIINPAANHGDSCIVLKGHGREQMPATAEFTVGEKCDVLYFLQGSAWVRGGELVARYRVSLADGTQYDVPVRAGREVNDWWKVADTKESAVGWDGRNAESDSVGLSIFPWRNPKLDVAVARVRVESAGTGAVPILVAVTAGDGPPVLEERPLKLEFTDTTGWYPWKFDLTDPTLKEIDLSSLLDAPAGKHGFLTTHPDGHLYFQDGTRARFFGTDIGGAGCCPDHATAERVAARLARYGVNLLRLHAIDSRWATLIDYTKGDSQHLNPAALDRYDYFVAQLLKRGIYVYFDLLDYRQFLPGDGVRDAAQMETRWTNSIKAASIFDRRMIELQKEYATQLLTHRNPYTGRRYVDEPGLAIQEITNENSVFYLQNQKLMLPSYVDELTKLWKQWLLRQYGSRAGLSKAWISSDGTTALGAAESPESGTVALPLRYLYADLNNTDDKGEKSPARLNNMTRLLYEIEVNYYDEMVQHLRSIGLKCPITGTNQDFSDASNFANSRCDVMTRNNYWCHPNFDAKPFFRFKNAAVVRSDIAATENPVANICSSTVAGKAMIAPEFNFPWPNEWRAECLPLMAVYGRLQDWDGLLYFAYGGKETLDSFGNATDPVRWGQMPLAALIFLRGDIDVARNEIEIGNSRTDCFATRRQRTADAYSPYRVLPYISKVRNAYFDTKYAGNADVVMASGHSASGDYSAAKHAIIFADSPFIDAADRTTDRGASAKQSEPHLQTQLLNPPLKTSAGTFDTAIVPSSMPPGAEPINAGGKVVGFISDRYCVFPSASGETDPAWLHRLYLQTAQRWKLPSAAPLSEAGHIFRSDTGQLVLNRDRGVFTAVAPRVRIATGFLGAVDHIDLGGVKVECRTPFASISIVALDGKPVESSQRLLITAVARAENTGEAYMNNHSALPEPGRPPILAEPVDCRITLPSGQIGKACPLGPDGEREDAARIKLSRAGTEISVELKDAHSPWILATAE